MAAALALAGCATTTVETTGPGANAPLCQSSDRQLSALVLWGAAWRADQKEASLRESVADRGISRFFSEATCFTTSVVLKTVAGKPALALTDEEAQRVAASHQPALERIAAIRVRELGPVVQLFGSPAIVDGGTEVVLEIRVLDARTGAIAADLRSHWKNGGPLVLKGTKTLEEDIRSALRAVFATTRTGD
jgi:hypothetical protein